MIWPVNLVSCALFNTLHSQQYAGIGTRGGLSRERFFFYYMLGGFCWYWVPGYLFQALSAFNWVCWIVPDNVTINQLFGTMSGLSFTVITFDWSQVAFIGSPLATPWWAGANIAFAVVFFYCKLGQSTFDSIFVNLMAPSFRDYLPCLALLQHLVRQIPSDGIQRCVRQHRPALQRDSDLVRRNQVRPSKVRIILSTVPANNVRHLVRSFLCVYHW